jgi:hypothetical protein
MMDYQLCKEHTNIQTQNNDHEMTVYISLELKDSNDTMTHSYNDWGRDKAQGKNHVDGRYNQSIRPLTVLYDFII